jgi:CheY-like chemotaxis protein
MRKALIIAADAALGSALTNWLALDEFETMVAWDSFIGLKLAYDHQPDLILCDVDMPELDGFSILDELQITPVQKKPWIVLIGQSDDASRAFAAGANGFLFKSMALSNVL